MSTHDREALKKTKKLAEDIRFCMMTTVSPEGHLLSRPMTTMEMDEDGGLWFFASLESEQTVAFDMDENVNIAYSEPSDSHYLSITGTASVVKDPLKIQELWSPMVSAWFPKGKTDPLLCLIKVDPIRAEYWESPSSKVVKLFGIAKAILTHSVPHLGVHEKIALN